MGLITPESGGLHMPRSAKGIEREAAPDGFEWLGGVLKPVAKAAPEVLKPSVEDIASANAGRAEMEKEAREKAQQPWKELGILSSAFLMPNQFDFMDLALKAVEARSGVRMPFTQKELRAHMQGGATNEYLKVKGITLGKAELSRLHASLTELYQAYAGEFRANPRVQDAFFSEVFLLSKLDRGEARGYSPELQRFAVSELGALDRNKSGYAIAKGMLAMYADTLDTTQAADILVVLRRNNDLYTDLGFLLWSAHPEAAKSISAADAAVFNLPAADLAAQAERYAAIAFTQPPEVIERPGSNIGYEIELALRTGLTQFKSKWLKDEIKKLSVVDSEKASLDGGGDAYELRSPYGGIAWTPARALELVRLGALLEKSDESIGIASVHINLDKKHLGDRTFMHRKIDDSRVEIQDIAKPAARLDTPYVNEMSVVLDQTEVLRELYSLNDGTETDFFNRQLELGLPTVADYIEYGTKNIELEFLIRLAQKNDKAYVVPALLRLYARNALPATNLEQRIATAVFHSDMSKEPLPYTAKTKAFFLKGNMNPLYLKQVAERVQMSLAEFADLEGHLAPALELVLVESLRTPLDSHLWFTLIEKCSWEGTQRALIRKIGRVEYGDDIEKLLLSSRCRLSTREDFAMHQVGKIPFPRIAPILSTSSVDYDTRILFVNLIRETAITPEIQSFLDDSDATSYVKGRVRERLEMNARRERREEAERAERAA